MFTETIRIDVDGEEAADLYEDLESVEVELDDELPGMFRLRLPLLQRPDGTWTSLDDERLRSWRRVVVSAGLGGELERLISGHVTHVRPAFDPDPTRCVLEVWGLDRSVLLDREDRLGTWPNKKDSDIAADIFSEHGFSSHVEDTEVVHDEAVSTIVQRETDWQFLNRLARRNGFECYVEGSTGHFERPRLDRRPQAVLAVHFGDETNVERFALEVNALTPANVALHQLERRTKDVVRATVDATRERRLGAAGPAAGPGVAEGLVVLDRTATTGAEEMANVARAVFEQQQWFVTGRGEVAANELGVVLRPRGNVTVKGVGEAFSGVYRVSHVTHAFSQDGYVQRFEVKRNALMPTGGEDFTGRATGLVEGLL
ncbi:MAG TPA: contractile injection system protein, VgrG/Pvc8 family [Solirubrobacteraceae bacterium]|nr:contractile injection system protein, VgrG/Pvc8 family [Solirubrobacteraceae bacterium]